MHNPFRYGEVAAGDAFTDRTAELAALEADVRNGQNVVVISPRRFGKTSLVLRAVDNLRHEGVLVAYVDLFRAPTKDRFAEQLAAAIYGGLVARPGQVWQRAVDLSRDLPLRPRVTLNQDGTPSFEFAAGSRTRDVDRTVEGLLAVPGQIAGQRKRRVALVLDEFQEVVALDPHLPALMRSVFQLQTDVAHVFLGSKRHLMQRVFTDADEPLYRLAKPMPLRAIASTDFGPFIRERFAATGQVILDEGVERVLALTDGHPHDTQELCYFTWEISQAEGTPATAATVESALAQVLDAEDARYTTLWDELSAHQRSALMAIAGEGDDVYSEAYRQAHRLGSASSLQRSLTRLVERELVEAVAPGHYRVSDVFLRAWVNRLTETTPGDAGGR